MKLYIFGKRLKEININYAANKHKYRFIEKENFIIAIPERYYFQNMQVTSLYDLILYAQIDNFIFSSFDIEEHLVTHIYKDNLNE